MAQKQYLKMADVITGDVVHICKDLFDGDGNLLDSVGLAYAAHAINSHDDLVQQNVNMQLRINELLTERNATGVAIDNAISGRLPEQHQMLNRLRMIANIAANRNELVAENERSLGLLDAAKAVVARWDTPNWKDAEPTAAVIGRLRTIISKCGGSAS